MLEKNSSIVQTLQKTLIKKIMVGNYWGLKPPAPPPATPLQYTVILFVQEISFGLCDISKPNKVCKQILLCLLLLIEISISFHLTEKSNTKLVFEESKVEVLIKGVKFVYQFRFRIIVIVGLTFFHNDVFLVSDN